MGVDKLGIVLHCRLVIVYLLALMSLDKFDKNQRTIYLLCGWQVCFNYIWKIPLLRKWAIVYFCIHLAE